jgi:hypothetical protein
MSKHSCGKDIPNGGFLSDKMGYGKSAIILIHIILNWLLALAWKEVLESRRNGDDLHLTNDAAEGECCPSDDPTTKKSKWCFPCPCASRITSSMRPPRGPALIAPPAGLVANWKTEWRKHIDPKNRLLNMKLLVNAFMSRVEAADMIEEMPNVEEFNSHKHGRLLQPVTLPSGAKIAAANTQKYVVLLSKNSHSTRIIDSDSGLSQTIWGIVAVDEFHDCKNMDTGFMKWLFRIHPATSIRFISATPWDKSPKDVQPALQIIQRQWYIIGYKPRSTTFQVLENTAVVKNLTDKQKKMRASHLDKATTAFNRIVKRGENRTFDPEHNTKDREDQDTVVGLIQTTLSPFMIRRTETTMWGDQPAVPMPRHEHRDIHAKFTKSTEDKKAQKKLIDFANQVEVEVVSSLQKAWDAREARGERNTYPRPTGISANNWLSHMRVARLYGCFPGLLDLDLAPKQLTGDGIDDFYKLTGPKEKQTWVYQNLDIIDKSPKLRVLRELIGRLEKETDGQWAEPMPIFTVGPVGAYIVYMVIFSF